MLDKTSKCFLNYLEKQPQQRIMYYEDPEYPDEIGDKNKFFAVIRYLEGLGYLEFIKNQHGTHMGVCLSHTGIHRKEYSWIAVKEYLLNKWIEIIALVIAVPAFIMALIALLD